MSLYPQNSAPSSASIEKQLLRANDIALASMSAGRHPFGATLVAPDHETVLLTQGNIDSVNHAESTLLRAAAARFDASYLWGCTLYTTVEPCAMCTATAYWANVGTIAYGVSEKALLDCTGAHPENPTMDLPCRDVVSRGQKPISVYGPIDAVQETLLAPHTQFWRAS